VKVSERVNVIRIVPLLGLNRDQVRCRFEKFGFGTTS